jgi:hypothetical protein
MPPRYCVPVVEEGREGGRKGKGIGENSRNASSSLLLHIHSFSSGSLLSSLPPSLPPSLRSLTNVIPLAVRLGGIMPLPEHLANPKKRLNEHVRHRVRK